MLQAICNCGRVAEVRRQKNGSRLAYTYCKVCKTGTRSLANSELVLAAAKDNIGEFGEFPPENSKQTPENNQSEKSGDWVPSEDVKPEALEPEGENSESETTQKPKRSLKLVGIAIGSLAVAGLAAFGYNASLKNKG